ncbi:MAG: cell wall hydrolase [Roseinatronobacter sp.]|nr:cell wall hydrolase [Roseinatronobacter sp.]
MILTRGFDRSFSVLRIGSSMRRRATFSAVCAAVVLIALPGVGSRMENATLSAANAAGAEAGQSNPAHRNALLADESALALGVPEAYNLVLRSLQHSNPARRNEVLTDFAQAEPIRLASLNSDLSIGVPLSYFGLPTLPQAIPDTPQVPRDPGMAGLEMAPSDAEAVVPRAQTSSAFAPGLSLRPPARPAGLERRVVHYSRTWLRSVPARPLSEEESCLATAIYHEARGESIRGQFAVAEVILNRVDSRKFPSSICGVVYQGVKQGRTGGCQFSFACDGNSEAMPNQNAALIARRIAQVMADGGHRALTQGAKYFHTTAVAPGWANRFTQTTHIGAHLFYRG